MLTISVEEVCAYREVYYEHVKPMIKARKQEADIDACIAYFAPEYGITKERYHELSTIDLLQRLAGLNTPMVKIQNGETSIGTDKIQAVLDLPELKCSKRTEQK